MYSEYEISNIPLSLKSARLNVERFLTQCGLRLDNVDTYAVVTRIDSDEILAGGGLEGNVVKCLAVSESLRGTGMMQRLISHLLSTAHEQGYSCVRVFTKPENRDIFESLSFTTLAIAPKAIFMEHGMPGINDYCNYLKAQATTHGTNNTGVIVMNANPFTLGHKALVEWAANQVETLYVIAVKEDLSQFGSDERYEMISQGCSHLQNVVVCKGSDYAISAQTFPTYFLKKLDDATDTHITLDLDLFARHIAPAIGARIRFVGSEPTDALTARYVELMQAVLPQHGIELRVMERILKDGKAVSASLVRNYLANGQLGLAISLVPTTTMPYLVAHAACNALQRELDTTPKPGLVDRNDSGSHSDMDYNLMQRSINVLRPYFIEMAKLSENDNLPLSDKICGIGIEAEQAMLSATMGINTHRGALFALGLTCIAASHLLRHDNTSLTQHELQATIITLAAGMPGASNTHGSTAVNNYKVDGALAMAQKGYMQLFDNWLPYYKQLSGNTWQCHMTLLLIISQLDDTNVIHRCGYEQAQQVKADAAALLDNFTASGLEQLNNEFTARNISPGGAADMLSLTIFIDSILSET